MQETRDEVKMTKSGWKMGHHVINLVNKMSHYLIPTSDNSNMPEIDNLGRESVSLIPN